MDCFWLSFDKRDEPREEVSKWERAAGLCFQNKTVGRGHSQLEFEFFGCKRRVDCYQSRSSEDGTVVWKAETKIGNEERARLLAVSCCFGGSIIPRPLYAEVFGEGGVHELIERRAGAGQKARQAQKDKLRAVALALERE